MENAKLLELLDFSDWTMHDAKDVRVLTDEELKEAEQNLTWYIDEMSQADHVNMVITYKARIAELETLLAEFSEDTDPEEIRKVLLDAVNKAKANKQ